MTGFTDSEASVAAPPTFEDGLELLETFCLQKATRFLEPPAHGVAALHGRRLRHSLVRRPGLLGGPLPTRHVEAELQVEEQEQEEKRAELEQQRRYFGGGLELHRLTRAGPLIPAPPARRRLKYPGSFYL